MSALQNLRKIVTGMSQEEINVARNLLGSFDSRGKNFSSKSIKLLNVLADEENELSENEIEYHLYGKHSSVAFSRLQIRFREKMLESLFLDVNIKREGVYSNQQKYNFEVRKKLSYAEILLEREQPDFALFLTNSCIELCEQYEYYEELLLAGRIKTKALILLGQFDDVEKTITTLKRWEIASKAALEAYISYTKIKATKFLQNKSDETEQVLSSLIHKLRLDYEETNSATVGYYFQALEIDYLHLIGRYRQARKTILRQNILIQNSPALYSPKRLGRLLLLNAKNEMYRHQFAASLTLCEEAQLLFENNSAEELQCLYIKFFNHFYLNDLTAAQLIVRDLLAQQLPHRSKQQTNKYQLAFAAVLFRQELFEQAVDLVNEMELDPDKSTDRNFGACLLQIMGTIECTIAAPSKQNERQLQNYLSRLKQVPQFRKRHQLIFEILDALVKSSLDFKTTYQEMRVQFEALNSDEQTCRWMIRSSELIIFHNWFFAHITRTTYIHKMPKYVESNDAI